MTRWRTPGPLISLLLLLGTAGCPVSDLLKNGLDPGEAGADSPLEVLPDSGPGDARPADAGPADARPGDASPEGSAGEEAGADGAPDAAVCDPMAPEGGTNYIVNPDFENPADAGYGWFAAFGGSFVVSDAHHCGAHSGESTNRTYFYEGLGANLPVTPGTYSITMWVMQDGTAPYELAPTGVLVCGDEETSFAHIGFPTLQPSVWTYVAGMMTVPSGCTSVVLAIDAAEGTPTGTALPNLFVDDVYAVR